MKLLVFGLLPAALLAQSRFDFRPVDQVLENAVSGLTPGLSVTIVADNRVVYRKSAGIFQTDERVPIASATKWYSAAVVLSLVDDGLLRLDDPISKLLPSFRDDKSVITLRTLLSHTSGLIGDLPCLYDVDSTMAGCVDRIAEQPLLFQPGTRFSYGNASMQVAGRLAEVVTGKPWAQLFTEKLAKPLGMTCTTLDAFGSPNNPVVANGAISCESDYLKFLRMLLGRGFYEGRFVLSPTVVAEMTADQTRGVPIDNTIYANFASLDPDLPELRYGFGAWRERIDPITGEAIELGSQGATGFSPWLDMERNVAVVLSTRSSQAAIMSSYLALKEAVHQAVQPWARRSIVVTNAASYNFGPVAPGEIITIFGNAIGPARETGAQLIGSRFTSELAGMRVLFDGVPAPLLFAGPDQISAVAPNFIGGNDRAVIQLEREGEAGPKLTAAVVPAAPAIFQGEAGRGVALNEDGTLNSPSNPARRGSIVVFYATGCGRTTPQTADGEIQTGTPELVARAQVAVNGVPASILYAGGAPGLIAGAAQINARLPPEIPVGDAVPLTLTVGGAAAPSVTISIR